MRSAPRLPGSKAGILFFRPKIDYENVIHRGQGHLHESSMLRVLNVGIAVLLTFERQNEAMREAFVAVLFAHVGAPFVTGNLRNFLLQGLKRVLDFVNIFGGSGGLEFE